MKSPLLKSNEKKESNPIQHIKQREQARTHGIRGKHRASKIIDELKKNSLQMLFTGRACVRRQAMNFDMVKVAVSKMRHRLTFYIYGTLYTVNGIPYTVKIQHTSALLETPHVCNRQFSDMLVSISTANSAFQHNYKYMRRLYRTLWFVVCICETTIDVLFCVRCFFFSSFICFSRNYYLIQIAVCDDVWLLNCNETS